MSTTLHFKTNALLKNLVGKDLINDDNIAIIELVKNAYDAGAHRTSISFLGDPTIETLVIVDDGHGMSRTDIVNKWLNIAYSEKKRARTETGLFYAGNKGIGRFSCDRLGTTLSLLTRQSAERVLRVDIDWLDFESNESADKLIQSIPITQTTVSEAQAAQLIHAQEFPASGTALVIGGLRAQWNRQKLRSVKTSLERFLNPNQPFMNASFVLDMHVERSATEDQSKPYNETLNGEIRNQIFSNLEFNATYISTTISSDGETIETQLNHEGKLVYAITEHNQLYKQLSDARVVIYYLNPYKKAYFKRQTGIRSVDFGSIFLFLNGFRVPPYGEAGDDWLGLERRKGQGHSRHLGGRDIIGRIEVVGSESADGEDTFKAVSSREGLKETATFLELKEGLFFDVLKRLERFVVDGLDWDSVPLNIREALKSEDGLDWKSSTERYQESWDRKRLRIGLSILPLIGTTTTRLKSMWFDSDLLDEVQAGRQADLDRLVGGIESFDHTQIDGNLRSDLANLARAFREKVTEATQAKQEASRLRTTVKQQGKKIRQLSSESENYRAQTLFMKSVTSNGVKDLVAFHHQICLDTSIIDNLLSKLMRLAKERASVEKMVSEIEKITRANRRIAAIAQFASKANFKSATKREPTDIPAFFEQYLTTVAPEFVATGLRLRVENSVKEAFECKCSRIELSMLIDNILSNADKAGAKAVEISLHMSGKNSLAIAFTDDGAGLSRSIPHIDQIFELGVTSTSGSGIGLYHVAEVIKSMDGTVTAQERGDGRTGLTILIEIPR